MLFFICDKISSYGNALNASFISRATEGATEGAISGASILNKRRLMRSIPTALSGLKLRRILLTMGGVIGGTVHSTSRCFLELKNLCSSSEFQLTLCKVDLKLSPTDLNVCETDQLSLFGQRSNWPSCAECLDIINYSSALKREIWKHSRLEKPITREERAETSSAAFIKFGFSIARGKNWETQERVFEEEGLILNLSLKRGSLRKYKDYSWAFENDEETDIFSVQTNFKSNFSKSQTGFKKPKRGKWKIGLSWSRFRFNLENWWTTTITEILKFLVEVPF